MVSKFREIKIPKEPLTMPVTVLVFRETLSLEHLIKLMIHFISSILNFIINVTCQNIRHRWATIAAPFHSNIFLFP